MHLETITGKLKVNRLAINKPVGAILVVCNQAFANVTNEEIGIQIESGSANVKIVQPKIKIADIAKIDSVGEGFIYNDGVSTFLWLPIAKEGSYPISNGEEIVVSFDGLKSAVTYEIYGVEVPAMSRVLYQYETVKMLADVKTKTIDCSEADVVYITSMSAINNLEITKVTETKGGSFASNHEFSRNELTAMVMKTNDIVAATAASGTNPAVAVYGFAEGFALPADLLSQLEIEKGAVEIDVVLRKPVYR